MKVNKLLYGDKAYPEWLAEIPAPPKELFSLGADPAKFWDKPRVAIVGSRGVSAYGKQVTARLSSELAARGVIIISGLALGVDAIAHQAALEAGGITWSVLPCGLDQIYPASNRGLAKQILINGGTIFSEYPIGTPCYKQNFIARNRLVSGLANVLVITEATEKSGSLHTARFALEQGRDVLAVPGNITSPTSVGTNNLIKSGATPITSADDVLYVLGAKRLSVEPIKLVGASPEEQTLIDILYSGITDGHELLIQSSLPVEQFNQALTMLEITGKIRALGNNNWSIK
ncbi:MAG: DNA-processing protein DprA [Candidatus Saccharimonadales bacterium]